MAPAGSAFWIDCMNHQFYHHSDETDLLTTASRHFSWSHSSKILPNSLSRPTSPVVKLSGNTLLCTYIRSLIDIYKHQSPDSLQIFCPPSFIVKIMTEMYYKIGFRHVWLKHRRRSSRVSFRMLWTDPSELYTKLTLDDFSRIFSVNKYYFQETIQEVYRLYPQRVLWHWRGLTRQKLLRSTSVLPLIRSPKRSVLIMPAIL